MPTQTVDRERPGKSGMSDKPIFFMHIAKTAGTSLNRVFTDAFGDDVMTHVEGMPLSREMLESSRFISGHVRHLVFRRFCKGIDYRFITLLRDPVDHLRSHLNWVKLQTIDQRHQPFISQNAPIKRLSEDLRKVNIARPDEIRRFLDGNLDNPECVTLFENCQTRYFIQAQANRALTYEDFVEAMNNMARFDFVGISEMFEASVERLAKELDLPLNARSVRENTTSYSRRIDRGQFRDELSDYLGYDLALYELAKTRFLRSI